MIRFGSVLVCALAVTSPAAALVGGASPAPEDAGRVVVMLTGTHGSFCSGVTLAPTLVLTAAHCVLPGAGYKLVEFDSMGGPHLKDIVQIVRHPDFDATAAQRHRVTADMALLKLSGPARTAAALLAPASATIATGDRLVVAGYGVAVRGDGRTGGTVRAATLTVTGKPGSLQIRLADPTTNGQRPGLGACSGDSGAPVFRDIGGLLAVVGVVSWSTGPASSDGCGGLTGVTPLTRYRGWIVQQAGKLGSPLQQFRTGPK
jgi:hypothetical protein